jgi:hypothetical protein
MSRINTAIDAFIACNSLDNASNLVAHARKFPRQLDMLTEDHAGQVRNAERMIESAGVKAKFKKDTQSALRARFPGMNIEVI